MSVVGLVPARFLTIIAHLVIAAVILWARDDNIRACLPLDYSQDEYDQKNIELIIGLSVMLGLLLLELVGFISGISMFMHSQGLISVAAHTSASVCLAFFLFDQWECNTFWYIFGFCSCLPAITEIFVMIGVLAFRKGI